MHASLSSQQNIVLRFNECIYTKVPLHLLQYCCCIDSSRQYAGGSANLKELLTYLWKKKKDLRTVITLVLCYSVMPEDLLKSKFLLTSMAILSRQGLINNCRTSVLETPDMYMIRNSFLPATTGPHVQFAKRISGTELHFKVFTMHIAFFHASRKQCGFVVGS